MVILEQQFCESCLGLAAMQVSGSATKLGSSQHSLDSHGRSVVDESDCRRERGVANLSTCSVERRRNELFATERDKEKEGDS